MMSRYCVGSVNFNSLTFTSLQVLSEEASELVIPIYPSAKGIQY